MGKRSRFRSLRFPRTALKLLCIVLGLILAAMVLVTAFCHRMMDRIQYLPRQTAPPQLELLPSTVPPMSDPVPLNASSEADEEAPGRQVIQILLIGQDRREGEERARSDSMILCTFRKDTKELYLTSLLRDLYVQIPGHQDNRLNAAYALGGMPLLNETLEHNFGIQVDGNVEVDFTRFSGIVDLLGGVTLELRADEAALLNKSMGCKLSEGENLLTGEQALQYARIRSLDSDGDFSRTNRQRNVITAMVQSCRDAGLFTLLSVMDEVLPLIATDMSRRELLSLARELFPLLPRLTIVSQHLPADGTYTDRTIRGMAVLVADMDAARKLLEGILPDETD